MSVLNAVRQTTMALTHDLVWIQKTFHIAMLWGPRYGAEIPRIREIPVISNYAEAKGNPDAKLLAKVQANFP